MNFILQKRDIVWVFKETIFSYFLLINYFTKKIMKGIGYQWAIKHKFGLLYVNKEMNSHLELQFRKLYDENDCDNDNILLKNNGLDFLTYCINEIPEPLQVIEVIRYIRYASRLIKPGYNWQLIQSNSCSSFPLRSDCIEYKKIESTILHSSPSTKILKIYRIQNIITYARYMEQYNQSDNPKELLLFHGTRSIDPSLIINSTEGFDCRYSKETNLWGSGSYFAEDFNYTKDYSYRDNNNIKQILLASVLVGDCFDYGTISNPKLRNTPFNIKNQKRYDSITGITNNSRVYCVFNNSKTYARYHILYQ